MTYSTQQFAEVLFNELALDAKQTFFLAYSGGVDSTVLLHLLREAQKEHGFDLVALHVNHNLQADSVQWAEHCASVCDKLDVPLRQVSLQLAKDNEVDARNARYKWFQDQVKYGDVLMTAHHRQDRAETFLFNLMRGAGSSGLSSLRAIRPFFGAKLARPLLGLSRQEIKHYAVEHQLSWVEDPSNHECNYSRNQIRHQVIPALRDFRQDAVQIIARAAANLEQENGLLREIAICDLVDVREHSKHPLDNSHALSFEDMAHLSPSRQANLVRFWLASLQLHIPSKRLLEKLLKAFMNPPESTAILQEDGCQFRFYKGFLYVMPALVEAKIFYEIDWQNIDQPIDLYDEKIRVDATDKLRHLSQRNHQGRVRLAARAQLNNPKAVQGHSLNLKKWLQEIGIPPWRRQALPLLTLSQNNSDMVLGPVDQQLYSEWVSLECPIG